MAGVESFLSRLRWMRSSAAPPSASAPVRSAGSSTYEAASSSRPVTFGQERLWFEEQNLSDAESSAFNVAIAANLQGPLNLGLLWRSVTHVARRHVVLRTVFTSSESGVTCETGPDRAVKPSAHDLSRVPDHGRKARLDQVLRQEACERFDLHDGRMLRLAIVRLSDFEHVVQITTHAIACDREGLALLMREVGRTYTAMMRKEESVIEIPTVSIDDFAAYQRALPSSVLKEHLDYWETVLSENVPPPAMPRIPGVQSVGDYSPRRLSWPLDKELLCKLRANGAIHREELEARIYGAFAVLSHQYACRSEALFLVTVSPRQMERWAEVIGPLSESVPLRMPITDSMPFSRVVEEVTTALRHARDYSAYPFPLIADEVLGTPGGGTEALFPTRIAVNASEPKAIQFGDATACVIDHRSGVGPIEFDMFVDLAGGLLQATFCRNTIDQSVVERATQHFETLLHWAAERPGPVYDSPVLSADEKAEQLRTVSNAASNTVPDGTLHGWFEEQVARTPDAVAVIFGPDRATYAELDARANRLANYLQSYDVAPDELVGVCLEKSIELIAAILGILKAGAAYLPLDPDHPEDRLRQLVGDAKARVLITARGVISSSTGFATQTINVDRDADLIDSMPCTPPASRTVSTDLAYCIYTSGSSGQPKGILVEHRHVMNLMRCEDGPFDFGRHDVWTMYHSACFDFSVWEVFGALLHGGRLVLVPPAVARDPASFVDLLCSERVTVLNVTPTAFAYISQEAATRQVFCQSLRYVIFGGEALHPRSLATFRSRFPAVRLVNMYGITEATVHVTYHEVTELDVSRNVSNIGRPLSGTSVLIVDEQLRLVPLGVAGELCVGGNRLARGYLARPDQDACRFISDPFRPGERLLRTGDLARFSPSGDLVYVGRNDDQVQIRGYRVEPGEIESVLLTHPSVRGAEVAARASELGNSHELVAYCVLGQAAVAADLRRFLAVRLPAYMVPSHFVMVPSLPLTSNGKVDRDSLTGPR